MKGGGKMSIGERIKNRRKELKLSVDEVAKKLGKNRATIYRYESDEIEDMPINVIADLAKILKVNPGYLMGWTNLKEDLNAVSEYTYIPTSISAGTPLVTEAITEQDVEKITIPDSFMGKWAGNKDIFIMRVNGDSMNKVFPHNSLIAVKEVELSQLKNGDIVVYSNNHDYAVKRFYRYDDELIFRPDSTDLRFSETRIKIDEAENIRIHGKVVLYIVELD